MPVAVEIREGAVSLPTFTHPRSAVYVLGPEDGSVSSEFMRRAKHVVSIPTCNCLNVAAAGTVVMYDRATKGVP